MATGITMAVIRMAKKDRGVCGSIYVTKSDDSAAHGRRNPATSATKDNTVGALTDGTIVWLLKSFPPQPVATTRASSAGIQAKRS
ncbi:hypothetical protein LTR37_000225 [Vermiconidia calcicola]|uniref:Uncharacterized protein n=1 Tax=Vermiconidia calcicola TaxID=1690605 RepID=A0ACC3NZ91_9PEZI|nr:hypothetical protein LTR37_000225 [Vermiconidia calcicola]